MKAAWYGPVLSPLLLVAGMCLLIFGIIILPTPAPGWLCIFIALGILSLVHPPTRRLTIWLASKLDIFFCLVRSAPSSSANQPRWIIDPLYDVGNGRNLPIHCTRPLAKYLASIGQRK
ncbi:TIGR02611 family protein [Corynebacterium diphtheriae bv. gravis]|nr:TIGR02611 family protein [Corynebacterium diphtheriae bv. gravis]